LASKEKEVLSETELDAKIDKELDETIKRVEKEKKK
jgi:hypothetical protein